MNYWNLIWIIKENCKSCNRISHWLFSGLVSKQKNFGIWWSYNIYFKELCLLIGPTSTTTILFETTVNDKGSSTVDSDVKLCGFQNAKSIVNVLCVFSILWYKTFVSINSLCYHHLDFVLWIFFINPGIGFVIIFKIKNPCTKINK